VTTLAALLGALFLKPALVIAAAAAITAGLRRHAAAARHAVWAGAMIATLALPAMRLVLPPLRIDARIAAQTITIQPGTPPREVAAWPMIGALTEMRVGGVTRADRLPTAIVIVWIFGALLLGARRIASGIRLRRILRRARLVSNPALARLLAATARAVEFRLSDEILSPAVTGVVRPVVLLPAAADTWAEADLAAVLIHELGHVARRDCLFNLLSDLATSIYWCNPIVRLAAGRMRAESERACDDRVLQGGADPGSYAHLLLRVARAANVAGGLPPSVIAMARPRELEARLLAVLDASVARQPLPRWMPVTFASIGILFALPTAAFTLQSAPEPDSLGDFLAGPASERVPLQAGVYQMSPRILQTLAGPDSILARLFVDALRHEPTDASDLIRERSAWALAQARNGYLIEPLLSALKAPDWRVQAYAAWALAPARDPRAVMPLIRLLDHGVWRLRAMAAYALRESQDPRAAAAMKTALTDPAWQVRLEAVEYFAARGGPLLDARLRPRLGDRHVAVRLAAEHALTR
jgi:beta-lactamase regulating signal transducer with metallopeptidase domain